MTPQTARDVRASGATQPDISAPGTAPETPAARFRRYHIEAREAPDLRAHPSRFRVKVERLRLLGMVLGELLRVRRREEVRVALSRPCVYGVFGRPVGGLAPRHHMCVGCLRCTTQYPEMVQVLPNPKRALLGDAYLAPAAVDTITHEARNGRVPVRGAGFRGAFGGEGWDAMWTDMSEIVRPTRDGIHGREFISTAVDLGERPPFLRFTVDGRVTGPQPATLGLPVPFLFDAPPERGVPDAVTRAVAQAAAELGTLAVVPLGEVRRLRLRGAHIVPLAGAGHAIELAELGWQPRMVEVSSWEETALRRLRDLLPETLVCLRLPLEADVVAAVERGARLLHVTADYHGRTGDRFVGDALRDLHARLVSSGLREEVTVIVSGGVALAEHLAKAIISGADAVALDTALWVALQARFSGECRRREDARVSFGRVKLDWGRQRIVNLASAWRDQLLEVLGAMGLREVRRLRGELGRCMFQDELEAEAFAGIARAAGGGETAPPPSAGRIALPALPPPHRAEVRLAGRSVELAVVEKHRDALHRGFAVWPRRDDRPPALGDARWPADLILATWLQGETGEAPEDGLEYRTGRSGGGFDRLELKVLPPAERLAEGEAVDTGISLNRRPYDPRVEIPVPWYGAGMSFGSVSEQVMLGRAMAAKRWRTFTCTGEGGYPESLVPLAAHVITQVATGMFGVREGTIARAPIVEFKYAQGAKPGLGGHLLGDKTTMAVAKMRESLPWVSLFSPFPFHSVYSVEDHKKHIDWVKTVNPEALVSVKVSTPTDVDMVAVGSYFAGAHIIHIDGSYGGTGAAPEIAKKNIAMPLELAIPKVHRFLVEEGIRDEVVLMASGGVRSAFDVAKAIALGADGCVLGTAELVAIGCTRCSNCERGRGCPYGLTTTDPELSQLVDPEWAAERISNLYASFQAQLRAILRGLGLSSVRALRGRTDLLLYRERG